MKQVAAFRERVRFSAGLGTESSVQQRRHCPRLGAVLARVLGCGGRLAASNHSVACAPSAPTSRPSPSTGPAECGSFIVSERRLLSNVLLQVPGVALLGSIGPSRQPGASQDNVSQILRYAGQRLPNSGRFRSRSGRKRPKLAEVGRPTWAEFSRPRAEPDQV